MNISLINKEDYQKALKRLQVIFNARPGTKEGDELDILALMIERYEDKHSPNHHPAILIRHKKTRAYPGF